MANFNAILQYFFFYLLGNLTAHHKTCTGVTKKRETFSLNSIVPPDTNQDIKLLHFNINPTKSSLLSPNHTNQQDGSPAPMFSKFRVDKTPTLNSQLIGEEYETSTNGAVIDSGRFDYGMNLEYLTEQYLSGAVGNVAEVYAHQAVPADQSQSVITKHLTTTTSTENTSSIVEQQEINDCTSLTSIQDQSYLERMNVGAFNVEDLFQDHTIDERFLNDCTSHIQDDITTSNELLMVPVSCWWPSPSPPPSSKLINNNIINNSIAEINGSTKSFSQTVIKNVSGGEIKDVSTLDV